MSGPAPSVADREDLVGGEPAEQGERDGDADGRPDQHVGRGSAPSAMSQPGQRHHPGRHQLVRRRQRPSGTNVYRTTTSVAAKCITGNDAGPNPLASPDGHPNGRGRRAYEPITSSEIVVSSCATIRARIRCRNRRSASRASTSPNPQMLRTHKEPAEGQRLHGVPVSPGASSPASHLTAASQTVTATAGPRKLPAKIMIDSATSTTKATSQPTPLVCR